MDNVWFHLDGHKAVFYDDFMNTHIVKENSPLLSYLLKNFPENKRTTSKQLLKFGAIMVNGKTVTRHDHPLKTGDEILFRPKPKQSVKQPLLTPDFPIIYEDESLVVINKPDGLLTVATEKEKTRTAYFELTDYVRSNSITGEGRIFIVHRLDRDSSGILVFAKDEAAKFSLQKNWDKTEKKYYAIVEGSPKIKSDTIESHLVQDKFRRVYSAKESKFSKYAATQYRVLRSSGKYSLLEVTLMTGRKNQIRVHLSDIGHPIIGDEKYGSVSNPAGRLGLHAFYLSLFHPETGEKKIFTSELPKELQKMVP